MNVRRGTMVSFMKHAFRRTRLWRVLFMVPAATLVFAFSAIAQDRYEPTDSPPPLKVISDADRKQLDASRDVKKRTRLALDLMDARLKVASAKSAAEDYGAMFLELGAFHALMDDTLTFLDRSSSSRKAILNNFKRFEIGLRRLAPRIELLRREAPPERERYLFYLGRNLRDARTRAIEPMFSETVVPQARQQQQNKP